MSSRMPVRTWTHDALPADVRRALDRIAELQDVAVVAVMPDVHLAKAVCVGTVVATHSHLFPDAVGGDIGCGMSALRFDTDANLLNDRIMAARVLTMLANQVPTSSHRSVNARLPDELASRKLSVSSLEKKKTKIARTQFATLGRGNHFIEFQRDAENALWLMVHSGSRGIGQGIREHHGGADGGLRSMPANSSLGQAYLHDLKWALDYARLSRRRMAEVVARRLEDVTGSVARWESYFDCHHNFVRQEKHQDRLLWVHRKGAISARLREPGIIPGSMGSASFHVEGRGDVESLCSSSHGAGRCLSRTEARRAISINKLVEQMTGIWFDHRIAGRLRDEAPGAYKNINKVMRAQKTLTRIVRRLEPVLVYKGT